MERKWNIQLFQDIVSYGNKAFKCDFPLPTGDTVLGIEVIGLVKYYNDFAITSRFLICFNKNNTGSGRGFYQCIQYTGTAWKVKMPYNTSKNDYDNFTGI